MKRMWESHAMPKNLPDTYLNKFALTRSGIGALPYANITSLL